MKFTFTTIFEIKIHEKKFLDIKKISFWEPDFDKITHTWTHTNPDSMGVNI